MAKPQKVKKVLKLSNKIWARPLIILGILGIGIAIAVTVSITRPSSFPLLAYNFHNGDVSYSFQYPSSFNLHSTNALSEQQYGNDQNGNLIGAVSASYSAYVLDPVNNSDSIIYDVLRKGNTNELQQFNQIVANQADCSNYKFLTTTKNKSILKCNLPAFLVKLSAGSTGGAVKGNVILAAGTHGFYIFQFMAHSDFWDSHIDSWQSMLTTVDFNEN